MSKVEREIVVQAPADVAYQVWRRFENFPNFMSNIEEVRDLGGGRSRWKAKGPLGADAEWDAEIVVDEPGRAIAWRSVEGTENRVRTQGAVRFESEGDATRVFVTMSYDGRSGGIGELISRIFSNPEKQVEADLLRFKEMVETQAGYQRSTEEVVGHGTPNTTMRVTDSVESGTEGDGEPHPVKGKRPATTGATEPPYGPGMSNDESMRGAPYPETPRRPAPRPTTTGTPGGTLGTPDEAELKRDEASISEMGEDLR